MIFSWHILQLELAIKIVLSSESIAIFSWEKIKVVDLWNTFQCSTIHCWGKHRSIHSRVVRKSAWFSPVSEEWAFSMLPMDVFPIGFRRPISEFPSEKRKKRLELKAKCDNCIIYIYLCWNSTYAIIYAITGNIQTVCVARKQIFRNSGIKGTVKTNNQ